MFVSHLQLHERKHIEQPMTACIGYFDGLHLGHQSLIDQVLAISKRTHTQPALITFEPDPWTVIKNIHDIAHITPMNKRMQIGEELGIQYWIILDFTHEMAALTIEQFHTLVLGQLSLHTLVCGYDFHYAKNGMGSVETLCSQSAFEVNIVNAVESEHMKISSSNIEVLIKQGDMQKAAALMGRYYEISGMIKKGKQKGHTIGFPTANLLMDDQYIIPRHGVYIGEVFMKDAWLPAMINIGHNPTFNYQQTVSMEAHILNFHENIYHKKTVFRFLAFIRDEQRFLNKDALILQLEQDIQTTSAYFQHMKERENAFKGI